MIFEEILPRLREGARARRSAWAGASWGLWSLELITFPPLPDGREPQPQLMIGYSDSEILRSFTGGSWDLLADDWEIIE